MRFSELTPAAQENALTNYYAIFNHLNRNEQTDKEIEISLEKTSYNKFDKAGNINHRINDQEVFNDTANNFSESNKSESAEVVQNIWCKSHGEAYHNIVVNACKTVGKEKVFYMLLSLGTAEFYLNQVILPKLA